MSRLVSRILLAVLMIPAAIIIYVMSVFLIQEVFRPRIFVGDRSVSLIFCGAATWAFMAGYWFILWKGSVRWTAARQAWTFGAFIGSALIAMFIGIIFNGIETGVGNGFGGVIAPIIWLIWVTLLWRETPKERAERIRSMDKTALVCPSCGYNLTGLQGTRCPECGTLYTLNELIAAQPSRAEDFTE